MKLLAGIIITLFASVWVALVLREQPGYVLFSMGQWTVETSFAFFTIFLGFAFFAFYGLIRLAIRLWRTPAKVLATNERYRQKKARRLLNLGIQQLSAGQWDTAEKTLLNGAANTRYPTLHYLHAARAVHHLNEVRWRRDLHLRRAEDAPDADKISVQLTRAEFFLDDGATDQARLTLEALHNLNPRHPGVLQGLAKTYQQLQAWESLQKLLPEVQKQKATSPETFAQWQAQTYRALLEIAASSGSLEALRALWKQTPATLREDDEQFLVGYATALCDCQAIEDAEKLLREAINRRWNPRLVVGYGMLGRGNATAQLEAAEGWLAGHSEDPYLLLTLGRLARRCQQEAKARDYLERSIRIMPTPDAYQELGELLESLHELTYAGQCFHAGLRLLVGKPPEQQGAVLSAPNAQQLAPYPPAAALA